MRSIVLPLGVLCLLCSSATASARPNIVFVLFDDLPYAGMSALGNTRIETPNMDRLAKEGMFFSRAYSLERYSEINKPFREGKGSPHEGGIRVPLVARWPGHIAPGSRSDSLVHFVDLLPTLAELAGAKPPADYVLDGRSLMPLFGGDSWSGRTLFTHFPHYVMHWGTTPGDAVIEDRWKLIRYPYDLVTYPGDRKDFETAQYAVGPRTELYDLQADPAERNNLAAQNPEVVAWLQAKLDRLIEETGARLPTVNPDYDPDNVMFNARLAAIAERDRKAKEEGE